MCLTFAGFPTAAEESAAGVEDTPTQTLTDDPYEAHPDTDAVYQAGADAAPVENDTVNVPILEAHNLVAPLSLDGAGVGAATIDRSKWDSYVAPSILSATAFLRDSTKTLSAVTSTSGVKRIDDQNTSYRIYFWMESTTAYWWSNAGTVYLPANCKHLFNRAVTSGLTTTYDTCKSLEVLDVRDFDTSKVTDMSYMFYGLTKVTALDVSGFNTGNVTNMSGMFYNCAMVSSLALSGFNTSKVESMSYMFYYCRSLTTLNLSSFNTSNVTSMENMFRSCLKLKELDLSNFKTSSAANMGEMFAVCALLSRLTVPGGFSPSSITASKNKPGYLMPALNHILNTDGTVTPVVTGSTDINSTKVKTTYIKVCTVTYHANEATSGDVPDQVDVLPNETATISGNTGNLQKTGYAFSGWNTKADGTGTDYAVGASVSPTSNITLYAQWTVSSYFSVTIPAALPVSAAADGTVTTASSLSIVNDSSDAIEVTEVSIVSESSGWTLVEYGQDFNAIPINTKRWAFQINEKDILTQASGIPETFGVVAADETASLAYQAKVTAESASTENLTLAQIVFVIDWAGRE